MKLILLTLCVVSAATLGAQEDNPVKAQNLALQDFRSDANRSWRVTFGTGITQTEKVTSNLFGETQDTNTDWRSDLTVRYNPQPSLQVFGFLFSSQSRRKLFSPFATSVEEEANDVGSGGIGVQWDLPQSWRLGTSSIQAAYRTPLSSGEVESATIAYSVVDAIDPLLMYGQLGYTQVFNKFEEVQDLQSKAIWTLTMGGAFVVNYSTSINAAVNVIYRTSEKFANANLTSDTEARLRLSVNRLLSERYSIEPYFDFRVDRTNGSFSSGINVSYSL